MTKAVTLSGCLLMVLFGCGDDLVQLRPHFKRSAATPCTTTINSQRQTMNGYIVELFLDSRKEAGASCVGCFGSERCALQERSCVCGPSRPTNGDELAAALAGVRFGPLPEAAYCLRVIALQRTSGPEPTRAMPCTCDLRWLEPIPPHTPESFGPGRICAFSSSTAVFSAGVDLTLDFACGDDRAPGGSVEDLLGRCANNPMAFPMR